MDNLFSYKAYKWQTEACLFNKDNEAVESQWFEKKADIIVLYFSANDVDKNGIIREFYRIYEDAKFLNIPIEVINVPMDETEEEMKQSFCKQANWFTLSFHDPLVHTLRYMYEITYIPQLLVLKYDGTIISRHGVLDLEEHGKNAVLTWLACDSPMSKRRSFSKESSIYGREWNYLSIDPNKKFRSPYNRKFSTTPETLEPSI